MNINYSYVRSCKARDLQERYNRLKIKDDLQVQTVLNGIILPLKKSVDLLFGAGGGN